MAELRLVKDLCPDRGKGRIVLVEDTETAAVYVLKSYSSGFVKEFRAEAEAYSLLPQSPCFLQFYGSGPTPHLIAEGNPEDSHCLCLQYAQYSDLESLLLRQACPLPIVRGLTQQLMLALKTMHDCGVTHNHLGLANLVLDEDFSLSVAGLGKSAYLQTAAERERSVQQDIFSCGVLVLRMLGYLNPFRKYNRFDPFYQLLLRDNFNWFWKAFLRGQPPLPQAEREFVEALLQLKRSKSLEALLQHDWFREPLGTREELQEWVHEGL